MYRYGKGEMGGACTDLGKMKWLEHVRNGKGEMRESCTDLGMLKWVEHVQIWER
jgi:hypothetical protein